MYVSGMRHAQALKRSVILSDQCIAHRETLDPLDPDLPALDAAQEKMIEAAYWRMDATRHDPSGQLKAKQRWPRG